MSRLVPLLEGTWVKADYGRWEFRSDPTDLGYEARIRDEESYESLLGIVRSRYSLLVSTPLALTYRLPLLLPEIYEAEGQPTDIKTDEDIRLFMMLRLCYPELTMCVTVGPENVATYEFQCRNPFHVGRHLYLPETEDDNLQLEAQIRYNGKTLQKQFFTLFF